MSGASESLSTGAASTVDAGPMTAAPASVGSAVPSSAADPRTAAALECLCALVGCEGSIESVIREICPSPRLQILQGCGRLSIGDGPGLVGSTRVFGAQSGAQIGVSSGSDAPTPQSCYGQLGQGFDCPDAKECNLCGPQQKPFAVVTARAAVANILAVNCGQCHGPIIDVGGIDYITDIDRLVAAGLIEPLDSAASLLIRVMRDGSMPPVSSGLPPVNTSDIAEVARLIDNGRLWAGAAVSGQDAGSRTPALEPCVYGN